MYNNDNNNNNTIACSLSGQLAGSFCIVMYRAFLQGSIVHGLTLRNNDVIISSKRRHFHVM